MAAYASVVSLAQTIQQFLHHDHPFPSTSLAGELHNIESLQENVNLLQAFLDDFPDKVTADLEGRIRDASNVAEDMIECFMLSSGSHDSPFVSHLKDLWKKLKVMDIKNTGKGDEHQEKDFPKFSPSLQKAATQNIGSIVAEVMDIKNTTTMKVDDSSASSSGFPPSSTGRHDIMVGFEEDLLAIKDRLCGDSSRLEIIPICGMGGIGKTTLARNSYEDPLTIHRFHIRAWVTVSQDYKAQEVLSRLQEASTKAFVEGQSGQGNETVYKSLKGRRYFIVLDDMWSTEVWDDVKRIFPDDNNGSRIILTTRLADVATYANSSGHLHQMRLLDGNWSWQLLQQKVFNKEQCPPQLEEIGRTIAGRCKGLPLAIVVVAGILSTINPTEASWKHVERKVISTFAASDDEITKIFSLSYTHLPHHLRPCFLYMGGFPEDHDIRVSKLVDLWTAEGFMKPAGGSKSFEEVGEVYLEDLVKRSLVFVTKREPNGKIKCCSIHDLLRDLCIRKAKEEEFLLCGDTFISDGSSHTSSRGNLNQCRRVIVGGSENFFERLNLLPLCGPTVHSIMFYGRQQLSGRTIPGILFDGRQQLSRLKKFKLLRVLDAQIMNFDEFPDNVSELSLLRYLAFHIMPYSKIIDVPPSISEFRNLQTLLIFTVGGYRLRFPLEIWSMRRLRHLHVVGKRALVLLPEPCSTAFPQQHLQILATITDFRCTEGVLQMIPNLKKLGIAYSLDESGEINWEEYHLNNLVHLGQLEELSIRVNISIPCSVPMWGEPQFPIMLKKLKLERLELSQQDMEIIGSMSNLEVLKLIDCRFVYGTWETTEREFPKLKVLKISRTYLKKWTTESSHFPSLKHLHLITCYDLDEIPEEIGEISTLELIEVVDEEMELIRGNKSLMESGKRIKEASGSYFGMVTHSAFPFSPFVANGGDSAQMCHKEAQPQPLYPLLFVFIFQFYFFPHLYEGVF